MNTKAFCLTAVAFVWANAASAQIMPASVNPCGDVCGSEGCCNNGWSGCSDQACCQGSGYACQNWCGNGCNGNGCFGNGCGLRNCSLGLTHCDHCPLGIGCDDSSCLTNSCLSNTCLGRCCCSKAYPDTGWAPPVRYPVNRDEVWYGNYLPQAAYGNPGGGFVANYPQVYQPTDTTQLGYSYAKVPTWQHQAGRIPPVPRPGVFHRRGCISGGHGHYGYYNHGGVYYGTSSCPDGNCQVSMHAPMMQQMPAQQFASAAGRPMVRQASARSKKSSPFSLTRLAELFD